MGSECSPHKPRYDVSMSRRTRRPMNLKIEPNQSKVHQCSTLQENFDDEEEKEKCMEVEISDHDQKQKSSKQLKENPRSLAQRFKEEEKQRELDVRQPEDRVKGAKLTQVVGHYVKVVKHMIKVNKEFQFWSLKKPAKKMKLIGYK